jgi:ABC-type glycerol-3-phosphate transport system substrate-binding protein
MKSRVLAALPPLMIGLALLLLPPGCTRNQEALDPEHQAERQSLPLRVVVIDTPLLAQSLKTQWLAHDGGEIQIREMRADDLRTTRRLLADVIIYPSGMIGELVKAGHLTPLSFPEGDLGWSGEAVLENQRVVEVNWGSDLYAVSFGSPQPMLAYRRDVFEQLEIQPPTTWAEYLETCLQLEAFRSSEQGMPFQQVTAEPLGPGDAAITLLARAASYARHRNQYSGLFDFISLEPLITGPAFQRALAELVQCRSFQPTAAICQTSPEAAGKISDGSSLMAISWSFRHPLPGSASGDPSPAAISIVELPGSTEVHNVNSGLWEVRPAGETVHVPLLAVGGRLGSVTELAYDHRQATDFLMFMTSSRMAAMVCRPSPFTFPFRKTHADDPRGWLPDNYDGIAAASLGEAVKNAGGRNNYLFCPRIPARQQYLDALDGAVQAALAGAPPAVALKQAADRWKEITEQTGTEQQKAAYRASLGL